MSSRKPEILSDASFEAWYLEAVRPRRLLVIDDEAVMHTAIEFALKGFNCNVHSAFTGPEGIEKFQSVVPDVVWLDVKLGGMDGVEVFQAIRAMEKAQGMALAPVVFVSGYLSQSVMDEIYRVGVALLLRKPDDTKVSTLQQVFRHLHIPAKPVIG